MNQFGNKRLEECKSVDRITGSPLLHKVWMSGTPEGFLSMGLRGINFYFVGEIECEQFVDKSWLHSWRQSTKEKVG